MKVCGAPTSLVASGAMVIRALTQVLTAGPLLSPTPSVFAGEDHALGVVNVVCALTVVVPVVGEVMVVVQRPGAARGHAAGRRVGRRGGAKGIDRGEVMTVPSGAFWKPPPPPRLALTWAVKVCGAPTRLVPFGVIWMLASWKTLVASPLLPPVPSVRP